MKTEAVYVTGSGLLSALPEAEELAWNALETFATTHNTVNAADCAPFFYHPLTAYNVEKHIPENSDRRMMGQVMQSAVYAVGKAIENAGLKNDLEALAQTDMIVVLVGGERDFIADQTVLNKLDATNPLLSLNASLMNEVRPTLFLSELPNLLASNIAIVHKVTGSSLTLMGDSIAGGQALALAYQKLKQGTTKRIIVTAVSANFYAPERLVAFACAKQMLTGKFLPVWQRKQGGICVGAAAGCIVLESASAAHARHAQTYAEISNVLVNYRAQENFEKQLLPLSQNICRILSVTSGQPSLIGQERAIYEKYNNNIALEIRSLTTALGALFEASMPVGVILATLCLIQKRLFAPLTTDCDIETVSDSSVPLSEIIVHCLAENNAHALIKLRATS